MASSRGKNKSPRQVYILRAPITLRGGQPALAGKKTEVADVGKHAIAEPKRALLVIQWVPTTALCAEWHSKLERYCEIFALSRST